MALIPPDLDDKLALIQRYIKPQTEAARIELLGIEAHVLASIIGVNSG